MTAPPLDPAVLTPGRASPTRDAAAAALRAGSRFLDRLALALTRPAADAAGADPRLEFYAEAGAPEGALYLDGRYIGTIVGINRL